MAGGQPNTQAVLPPGKRSGTHRENLKFKIISPENLKFKIISQF